MVVSALSRNAAAQSSTLRHWMVDVRVSKRVDVLEVCRGPTAHLLSLSCWYRSLECKLSYLLIGSLAASIPLQALLAASECLSPPPREPAEPEQADSRSIGFHGRKKAWAGGFGIPSSCRVADRLLGLPLRWNWKYCENGERSGCFRPLVHCKLAKA